MSSTAPGIIDSHVHFIEPRLRSYPWMREVPALSRPWLPADYARASAAVPVRALVFVEVCPEPSRCVEEARWVEGLRAAEPRIAAIVARAALTDRVGREAQLDELAGIAAVRAVRDVIQWEGAGYCSQPAYLEGARLCAARGLLCELCIFHPQLDDVLRLVAACPEVRFVLDHCGKPGIAAGEREPWASRMRELARHDNVVCKVSALLTEADHTRWTAADLRPYLDHVVDCFGPQRLLFGGDWPVCTLAGSWADWYAICADLTASWSAPERQAFYHDNAARLYRIDERGTSA